MKTTQTLPENYGELLTVDLQKNKKLAFWVNFSAILIAIVMLIIMWIFVPIKHLFDLSDGFWPYALRFAVLIFALLAYIVLHEAVHGIAMKICGASKTRFGFTGLYAYAGSEVDFFGKGAYLMIALAPVVFFGILFALLQAFLPLSPAWLWVIYFLQIGNVSGAVGDLYVTVRFLSLPKNILVRDTGVSMTVFAPQKEE